MATVAYRFGTLGTARFSIHFSHVFWFHLALGLFVKHGPPALKILFRQTALTESTSKQ